MGISDNEIFREFVPAIRPYLENLKDGDRIAWLGQQSYKMAQKSGMFGQLSCHIKAEVEHHCFDIENKNFEGFNIYSNWWDANDSWENKIQGFDLVLGIRILYACDSAKQTLKNLKYVVDNNRTVVFDFMSGDSIGGRYKNEVLAKKNNGTTLLPFFPSLYGEGFKVQPSHDDQVLTLKDLEDSGILFKNILTFRDAVKYRFYSLMEIDSAT
jgi:hypothetical protein